MTFLIGLFLFAFFKNTYTKLLVSVSLVEYSTGNIQISKCSIYGGFNPCKVFSHNMKFGMWTKFGMELSNIKEIIENDAYLINYS